MKKDIKILVVRDSNKVVHIESLQDEYTNIQFEISFDNLCYETIYELTNISDNSMFKLYHNSVYFYEIEAYHLSNFKLDKMSFIIETKTIEIE